MDDWLAGEEEFNWHDDPRHGGYPSDSGDDAFGGWPVPERPVEARTRPRRESAPSHQDVVRRRRTVALLGLSGLIAAVIVAIVIVSTGGSKSNAPLVPTTAQTTPATTQPAATTPASTSTTPSTTTAPATDQSSLQVTLPDSGTLARGDNGDAVLALQKALAALNYDVGTPDGDFGPTTEAAVKAFQQDQGLTADGIVGSTTVQALNDALAATSG